MIDQRAAKSKLDNLECKVKCTHFTINFVESAKKAFGDGETLPGRFSKSCIEFVKVASYLAFLNHEVRYRSETSEYSSGTGSAAAGATRGASGAFPAGTLFCGGGAPLSSTDLTTSRRA